MDERFERVQEITRRHFFGQCGVGIGALAFASLFERLAAASGTSSAAADPLAPKAPHHRPRAKSVIYLHMAGSPPQHELFDYKPVLIQHNDQPCPAEYLKGERFAFI